MTSFGTRYDLDYATVRRLTAARLDADPGRSRYLRDAVGPGAPHAAHPGRSRSLRVAVGPADPLADVARTVEREVFQARFDNDPMAMVQEHADHEALSHFVLILDRRRRVPAA